MRSVRNVRECRALRLKRSRRLPTLNANGPFGFTSTRKDTTMIIGNFTYDLERDTYAGAITTLTLQRGSVVFRPTEKNGDKEPDYRVIHETEAGTVELGAAWKRSSERGREFLSVLLD